MADGIIDIRRYLDGGDEEDPSAFALWGGDGERSRFALPLWRIIYLAGGDRGAIVSALLRPGNTVEPLIVLDLRTDPARLDFSAFPMLAEAPQSAPQLADRGKGGVTIFLGEGIARAWYLLVDGTDGRIEPLDARAKEDILFLAGECAGLLFFRDLGDLKD